MVSESSVSDGNIIYEAFFFDGRTKIEFLFIDSMEKKKSEAKSICNPSSFSKLPLSSRKAVKTSNIQFSLKKNNGFIKYVFCRNWTVSNPAGTRLDSSSLVNKQVDG